MFLSHVRDRVVERILDWLELHKGSEADLNCRNMAERLCGEYFNEIVESETVFRVREVPDRFATQLADAIEALTEQAATTEDTDDLVDGGLDEIVQKDIEEFLRSLTDWISWEARFFFEEQSQ